MSKDQETLPWDTETSDDWIAGVNRLPWTYDPELNEYRKVGKCPRCKHPMQRILRENMVMLDTTGYVDIYCNCSHPHAGRPASVTWGCGNGSKACDDPQENPKR
jgi:hypothetical protein